jgi:hypothetical protein
VKENQPLHPKRLKRKGLFGPIPAGAVYVGRPSKFGNPFKVGQDGTRAEGIRRFEAHLAKHPDLIMAVKAELRGKDLVCHCPLDQPCHADILLSIANEL